MDPSYLEGRGVDRALSYLSYCRTLFSSCEPESFTPDITLEGRDCREKNEMNENEGNQQQRPLKEEVKKTKEIRQSVQRGVRLLHEMLKSSSTGTGRPVGISGEELLQRLQTAWAVGTVSSPLLPSQTTPRSPEKDGAAMTPLSSSFPSSSEEAVPSAPGALSLSLLHRIFEEASVFYCFVHDNSDNVQGEESIGNPKEHTNLFYWFPWEIVLTKVAHSIPYEGATEAQFLSYLSQAIAPLSPSATTTSTTVLPVPLLPPYNVSFLQENSEDGTSFVLVSAGKQSHSGHAGGTPMPSSFPLLRASDRFGFWIHHFFPHLFSLTRSVKCSGCLLYYTRLHPSVLAPFHLALPPFSGSNTSAVWSNRIQNSTNGVERGIGRWYSAEERPLHSNAGNSGAVDQVHQKNPNATFSPSKDESASQRTECARQITEEDGMLMSEVYAALATVNRDKVPVWTSFKDVVLPFIQAIRETSCRPLVKEISTEEWYYIFRTSPLLFPHFQLRPSILEEENTEAKGFANLSARSLGSSSVVATEPHERGNTQETSRCDSPISSFGTTVTTPTSTIHTPQDGEKTGPHHGTIQCTNDLRPSPIWILLDAVSLGGSDRASTEKVSSLLSSVVNAIQKWLPSSSFPSPAATVASATSDNTSIPSNDFLSQETFSSVRVSEPQECDEIHVVVFAPAVDTPTVSAASAVTAGEAGKKEDVSQSASIDDRFSGVLGKCNTNVFLSQLKEVSRETKVQFVPVDDLLETKHVLEAFLEGPEGREIVVRRIQDEKENETCLGVREEHSRHVARWNNACCSSFSSSVPSKIIVVCDDSVLPDMKKAVLGSNGWKGATKVEAPQQDEAKKDAENHLSPPETQQPFQSPECVQPVLFFTCSHSSGIDSASI